jgi:hypothetical protein
MNTSVTVEYPQPGLTKGTDSCPPSEARPDSTKVDEDGKPLKVGDVVERSGGGGGQAVRLGRAATGSSNISIGHAVWQSD